MDYNDIIPQKDGILLTGVRHFRLGETLDNGQAFRWKMLGENPNHYAGIAFDTYVEFLVKEEDTLFIKHLTKESFEKQWKQYLDFETDYGKIKEQFAGDATLRDAMAYGPGLRMLRQQPWEILITFIFSQNNNIPRIKGLVERFCENFGKPIMGGYSFPKPEDIASLTVEDLAVVRGGFRSKYILAAAQDVQSGKVSLTLPYTLPIEEAREHLMQIFGVGPKVADCVLLFGFYRIEAFPEDVWMKRALKHFYPKGFPNELLPWAGIAQQYLFLYTRENAELLPKEKPKKKTSPKKKKS